MVSKNPHGGVNLWFTPRVTVVSRPWFMEPLHMRVDHVDLDEPSQGELLVEYAGRLCYMSQHNPAQRTTAEYLTNILEQGHGSVLEHANYSLLLEGVSRALSHELIRHRAGTAVSQLSQRFVGTWPEMVVPPAVLVEGDQAVQGWQRAVGRILHEYATQMDLLQNYGVQGKRLKEAARALLPNATETKLVFTANLRAWRHMIELRAAPGADAEMQRLFRLILKTLRPCAPAVFSDFSEDGVPVHSKV